MRRTTTLTALLLGATLLAPAGSATAVGETCQGEAATIVGTTDEIQGTDGRDVIVTGVSLGIVAGAGDDLICVTGEGARANLVDVDAGAGNDVVDSAAMGRTFYLTAILGEGSDTFIGGPGGDTVRTGASSGYTQVADTERDVVDTSEGNDTVVTGVAGATNADEVRLGEGHDSATWMGTAEPGSVLDGGSEDDNLSLTGSGATYVVDLPGGAATADGVRQLQYVGFESYYLTGSASARTIEVVGTPGRDDIRFEASARLVAHLGAGTDSLEGVPPLAGSVIDMGAGEEELALRAPDQRLDLDLEDRTLKVDGQPIAEVSGVENAYVIAREVRLEGDRGNNSLAWRGCKGRLEGGAGRDALETTYDYIWETTFTCPRTKVAMVGGRGNDTVKGKLFPTRIIGGGGNDMLTGSSDDDVILGGGGRDTLSGKSGNDRLIGGTGRDRAIGSKGRDRCDAEVEKSCEL